MNRVARKLLNVMRIEVLLGIGLVMWVFSLEARALDLTCFYEKDGEQKITELKNLQPEKGVVEVQRDCQDRTKPCKYAYTEVWSDDKVGVSESTFFNKYYELHEIDRRTLRYNRTVIIDEKHVLKYSGLCQQGLLDKKI